MKEYFVYIILCSDGSYYTGITNDYQKRFAEHAMGIDPSCYTYRRRPLKLVYVESYADVRCAIAAEKKIKGWGRKKKEAFIYGDIAMLAMLSACRNDSHCKYFRK